MIDLLLTRDMCSNDNSYLNYYFYNKDYDYAIILHLDVIDAGMRLYLQSNKKYPINHSNHINYGDAITQILENKIEKLIHELPFNVHYENLAGETILYFETYEDMLFFKLKYS